MVFVEGIWRVTMIACANSRWKFHSRGWKCFNNPTGRFRHQKSNFSSRSFRLVGENWRIIYSQSLSSTLWRKL